MAITEHDREAAEASLSDEMRDHPKAIGARYDRRVSRVMVALDNGLELAFPTRLAEGLEHAALAELADIEISPTGLGLHWPKLDADLYVPALLAGVFGSKRWMAAQRVSTGDRVTSAPKSASPRATGPRTGKPRKLETA